MYLYIPGFLTNRKKFFITIIVVLLLGGNIILATKCYFEIKDFKAAEKELQSQKLNIKIISFSKLFIEKVLKASGEVSFEDRLQLENTVRSLEDEEIFDQWEKFTSSTTETGAQQEVINLLELLVKKMQL
jgi:hypothetical protein